MEKNGKNGGTEEVLDEKVKMEVGDTGGQKEVEEGQESESEIRESESERYRFRRTVYGELFKDEQLLVVCRNLGIDEDGRKEVKKAFNMVIDKLVTCIEYGKVYGAMRGEESYSGRRIYGMAHRGLLNKYVINGIMFIVMNQAESDIYMTISKDGYEKGFDISLRKWFMSDGKTRDEASRIEMERTLAYQTWKKGKAQQMVVGNRVVSGKVYEGAEWDKFFSTVYPKWANKYGVDSIGMWLKGSGYYPKGNDDLSIVDMFVVTVGSVYQEYCDWCAETGNFAFKVREFSLRMNAEGFHRKSRDRSRAFIVIKYSAIHERRMAEVKEWVLEEEQTQRNRQTVEDIFLSERDGRYDAARLHGEYSAFCRSRHAMPKGRNDFYKLCVAAGFRRETKNGRLVMDKRHRNSTERGNR